MVFWSPVDQGLLSDFHLAMGVFLPNITFASTITINVLVCQGLNKLYLNQSPINGMSPAQSLGLALIYMDHWIWPGRTSSVCCYVTSNATPKSHLFTNDATLDASIFNQRIIKELFFFWKKIESHTKTVPPLNNKRAYMTLKKTEGWWSIITSLESFWTEYSWYISIITCI